MDLEVAIHLIAKGIPKTGSTQSWADLGAGSGLFTVALSHLLPLGSMIDAVDRDGSALRKIKIDTQHASLNTIQDDFEKANILKAPLDGIVMANSLHFVADHLTFVKNLRKTLKPSGRLIIVEYDMKSSSHWVPYPVQYNELKILGAKAGFIDVTKMGEVPSVLNRTLIYSALMISPDDAGQQTW